MTTMAQPATEKSPVNGEEIRRQREQQGHTQVSFVNAMGGRPSLAVVQRAEASDPTVSRVTMLKIAEALGVDIESIYDESAAAALSDAKREAPKPPPWFQQWAEQNATAQQDIIRRQKLIMRKLGMDDS